MIKIQLTQFYHEQEGKLWTCTVLDLDLDTLPINPIFPCIKHQGHNFKQCGTLISFFFKYTHTQQNIRFYLTTKIWCNFT